MSTPPFNQHSQLPAHLPVLNLNEEDIPPGWYRPARGEVVRSHWQAFVLLPSPRWRLTAYWTSDGCINQGLTHYRSPSSARAWAQVLPQLARKAWRRLLKGKPKVPTSPSS